MQTIILTVMTMTLLAGASLASAWPVEVGPAWATVASACQPDESTAHLGSADAARVSFRPGAVSPRNRWGKALSIVWRCAVPPPPDGATWTALLVAYTDPDGAAGEASVAVALKRHSRAGRSEFLASVQSALSRETTRVERWTTFAPLDFTAYTYWIEIHLTRRSTTVPSPRVYTVRLTTLTAGE